MADDWTEVHSLTDATGKRVVIARAGGLVRFAVMGAGVVQCQVVLDGDGRDEFMRAFAEAERRAEAQVPCG